MHQTSILLLVPLLYSSGALAAWGQVIRTDSGELTEGLQIHLSTYRKRLVLVHAILAVVAWLLLAPCAIIISRYLKNRVFMKNGKWVKAHMVLGLGTAGLMVASMFPYPLVVEIVPLSIMLIIF